MRRYLLGTAAVLATSGFTYAQFRGGVGHAPPPHMGGAPHVAGYRPVGPYLLQTPGSYRSPGVGVNGYGVYGLGGGINLSRGYGYGYGPGVILGGGYGPYYAPPPPSYPSGGGGGPAYDPGPSEPSGATAVSGILPATLIVQYPAAAKVWLDGVAVPGEADTTWTFTSKNLRPGESATFKVRGRWEAGGKTYEAAREIPLGPGARSRLLVVSGNEVTE